MPQILHRAIEVEVLGVGGVDSNEGSSGDSGDSHSDDGGHNCHFHAGIEHCVLDEAESGVAECSRQHRDYDIPLKVGLIFVILVTSFIGAAGPIFLKPVLPRKFQTVFVFLKQFGAGVIISTVFVHLFTHAQLTFTNECLGKLEYEATPAAIVMAGLFLAFAVEYTSHRVAQSFTTNTQYDNEYTGVLVLEAGIIFHSVLIGIALVVASDGFFVALFVVTLFHQMFEGLALGTRIVSVGLRARVDGGNARHTPPAENQHLSVQGPSYTDNSNSLDGTKDRESLSVPKKLLMATAFAVTTPVGMGIGIGALEQFNGKDRGTLIALGTLDAVSAGILVWVGVVEMWARDWMFGGELTHASLAMTSLAGSGLVAGMAFMSLLGKWA
ncbi:hypothetical protein F5Y06DRAFT_255426 [Hypoxylon sp. FL0890]|nr:hypothetical protein F5Y06DRAFT_255426 [Hypoxylon sp. FL0890]